MKWHIRRVIKKGKGSVSYEEEIHFGDTLTIGRAADQAIFVNDLRAALEHATVTVLGNGRYRVEALVASGIRLDGKLEQNATATSGSQIEVGNSRITLIEPPKDFEAAVEVALIDKTEVAAREESEALPMTLAEAGIGKRRAAWIGLISMLIIGLAIPIVAHYMPTLRIATAGMPMVGMNAWDTGHLHDAHHTMAGDCQACHGSPFSVVEDAKCVVCHAATPAHADPAEFPLPDIAQARCAHCHRDHNGNEGLVRNDQVLCSDCHRNLTERIPNQTLLANVEDFGNAHPQFSVLLPAWAEDGSFAPVRTSMDKTPLIETSGLKFPHATHLRERGVTSPDGTVNMVCADCHVAEPGGALIAPIDFEQHCQSCHRLDFDLRVPDRQVPHADVAAVQYMLDEFYAKVALEGGYDDVSAPVIVRQRRRPGQPPPTPEERREALAWAQQKATQTTDTLFSGRACGVCHSVSKDPAAVRGGWQVAPVRVAGQWYEKSRFTHNAHVTMDCEACHIASQSQSSADLLIPEITNCRQCHAGEHDKELLPSTCIACHGFHQSEHLLR